MLAILKKQREFFFIFTYILGIFALVYFVMNPMYGSIESKKNSIQEEIAIQDLKTRKLSELPKMRQQFEFVNEKKDFINVLLRQDDAVLLIEKLEKLAESTGNKISIAIPEVQKKKPAATTGANAKKEEPSIADTLPSSDYLLMDIVVSGNYQSVVFFMEKLESMEYLNDVVGLQFDLHKQKDGQELAVETNVFSPTVSVKQPVKATSIENEILDAKINVAFYLKK